MFNIEKQWFFFSIHVNIDLELDKVILILRLKKLQDIDLDVSFLGLGMENTSTLATTRPWSLSTPASAARAGASRTSEVISWWKMKNMVKNVGGVWQCTESIKMSYLIKKVSSPRIILILLRKELKWLFQPFTE